MESLNQKVEDLNMNEEEGEDLSYEQFLVYSARLGDEQGVQEMLDVEEEPVEVNYKDETMSYNTALHVASANGHFNIVNMLLKNKNIKTDEQNEFGSTALHYACTNGHINVVEALLAAKANPDIKNTQGFVPMEEALRMNNGQIAEILAPVTTLEEDRVYA